MAGLFQPQVSPRRTPTPTLTLTLTGGWGRKALPQREAPHMLFHTVQPTDAVKPNPVRYHPTGVVPHQVPHPPAPRNGQRSPFPFPRAVSPATCADFPLEPSTQTRSEKPQPRCKPPPPGVGPHPQRVERAPSANPTLWEVSGWLPTPTPIRYRIARKLRRPCLTWAKR